MRLLLVIVLVHSLLLGICSAQSCDANAPYRSINGSCNNINDPNMGTPGRFLSRGIEGGEFEDGVSTPINSTRPNERVVSNAVCRTDPARTEPNKHSMFATQFGQFITHDLEDSRTTHTRPQDMVFDIAIWVQEMDDSLCQGPVSPTNATIRNYCATGVPQRFRLKSSEGEIVHNRFEVYNDVTSWLDLSTIYGSTDAAASVLRTHSGGRLLTEDYDGILPEIAGPYPPNSTYHFEDMPPSAATTGLPLGTNAFTPFFIFHLNLTTFFASGDMRLNENVGLLSFHVIFTREHNRLADRLRARHPFWNDEKIYQEARARNVAQYQNIVLYQYLPTILGDANAAKIGPYRGYKPNVNVDTDNAFASAAFRYGHFAMRPWVARDRCGQGTLIGVPSNEPVPFVGQLASFSGFNAPLWNIGRPGSIENVVRGQISTLAGPISTGAVSQIRDILNRPGGTDIIGIDLSRARLNGIPNYARLRDAYNDGQDRIIYGLPGCPEWYQREPNMTDPIACFNHITDNNTNTISPPQNSLAYKLQQLYKKVNRIDAIIGLMAEKHPEGESFPTTLANMIISTYNKVRAADRFWFERIYDGLELRDIKRTSFGDIIRRNLDDVGYVPDNPFSVPHNYLQRLAATCDK